MQRTSRGDAVERGDAVGVHSRRRRFGTGLLLGASLLAWAGCSSDDSQPAGSPSSVVDPTTTPSTSATTPDPSEPVPAPATTTNADENGLVQATVEGLTFRYPEELFVGVESLTVPDEPAVAITLTGRDPSGRDATITVRTVRERSGDFLASATADHRDLVVGLDTGSSAGDPLEFVNGAGVRRVDEDRYVFDGLTGEGAHLVVVEAPLPEDTDATPTLAALDALVGSMFVDTGAPVLQDGCHHAVEVITEVELDPGRVVTPGEIVTATWTNRNTGTCAWTAADNWVFTGGDPVTMLDAASIARVEPGDEHAVTLSFLAPDEPGFYAVQWQFLPSGQLEPIQPIQAVSVEVVAN